MFDKRDGIIMPPSPGSLLRDKRSEYGWSVVDVARTLCLSVGQLEALEDDDYKNLPGRTYVLGYWKNYSSLLSISIEDSIEAHLKNLPGLASSIAVQPDHQRFRLSFEQSRHRFTLLFVLLSVIFLGAIWYWQSPQPESLTGREDWQTENILPPVVAAPEIPSPEISSGEVEAPDDGANDEPVPAPPNSNSIIALPEPSFSEENAPLRFDSVEGASAFAEGALPNPAEQLAENADVAEPANVAENADVHSPQTAAINYAATTPAESPPASPATEIVFSIDEKSWLEVLDHTGERLIYRTVEPDQRLTLKGMPPFSVFIGNVEGVSVEYLGKPVPVEPYRNGLFARFKVGEQ